MASRILDQNPVYLDSSGAVCAGGSLTFTITATTTAKNVFTTRALAVSLGNVITLDVDGRAPGDIWLASDVAYRVVLKTAGAVTVWTKDDVSDTTASGVTVLNPTAGTNLQVYSTTGVAAYWRTIREVPDPTGASAKVLTNDGSALSWVALAAATAYTSTSLPGGILQGATSFQIGKFLVQTGSGSAPAVSTLQTSAAITFPTAYVTLLHVSASPSAAGIVDGGGESGVASSCISRSATGFTASFYLGLDHASDHRIASAVPFTWVSYGLVA